MAKQCGWYARKSIIPIGILLCLVFAGYCVYYNPMGDIRFMRQQGYINQDDIFIKNKNTGETEVDIADLEKLKAQKEREKSKKLQAQKVSKNADLFADIPKEQAIKAQKIPQSRQFDAPRPKYTVENHKPNQYIQKPKKFTWKEDNDYGTDLPSNFESDIERLSRYKLERENESKYSLWFIWKGFKSLFFLNTEVCDMKEFTTHYIQNCIFEKENLRTDAKTVKECQKDCCKANDCGTFSFIDENIESMDRCILYSGEVQNFVCSRHPWRIRHFQRQCGFKKLLAPEIQNKYPIDAIVTEKFTKSTMKDCEFACCSSPSCYAVSFIESPDINRKNPLHNCRLISNVEYMLNSKNFVGMDGFGGITDGQMKVTHKQVLVHLSYNPCSDHKTCDTCVVSTHVGKKDNDNAITLSKENLCLWNSFDNICMYQYEADKKKVSADHRQHSCVAGKNDRWFERGYSYCESGLSAYGDENGKKHDCHVSFDIKDQMPYNCLAHTNNVTPKKCETVCNNNGDCAHYSFNPIKGCILLNECYKWSLDRNDYTKSYYRTYKDHWISKSKPKGMWKLSYAGICDKKHIYPNAIDGINILDPEILKSSEIKCDENNGCVIKNVPNKIRCVQYCIAADPCSEIFFDTISRSCTLVEQCTSRKYKFPEQLQAWVPEMIERKMILDKNRCRDRFPDNGNLLSMVCPIGMSLDAKRKKCCNVYYEDYETPVSAIGWIKEEFAFDGPIWKSILDLSCCGGARIDKIEDMICGDIGCIPNERTRVQQCQRFCDSRKWCVGIVTGGKKNPYLCRLIPQCDYPCIQKHHEWKQKPGVRKQDIAPLQCEQFNSICVNPYYEKPVGGQNMCCKIIGEDHHDVQNMLLNTFDKQVMPDLRHIHRSPKTCRKFLDKDENDNVLDMETKTNLCRKQMDTLYVQGTMMDCLKEQTKITSGRTQYKCKVKHKNVVKCSVNQCYYFTLNNKVVVASSFNIPPTVPHPEQKCYCATHLKKSPKDETVTPEKLPCVYPWKSRNGRVYNDGNCYSDPASGVGKVCAIKVNTYNLMVSELGMGCVLCNCKYNTYQLVELPEIDSKTMAFKNAHCNPLELTGPKKGAFELCKNGQCISVRKIEITKCWRNIRTRYSDGSVSWDHYPSDAYCTAAETPMRKINLDWKTYRNKGASALPSVTTLLKKTNSPIDRQDCIRHVLQNSYKTTQLFTGVLVVQYGNRYECRGVYDTGPFIYTTKYIKNSNTMCKEGKKYKTTYDRMHKAKNACDNNNLCVGVYVQNCHMDKYTEYELCKETTTTTGTEYEKDCVFEKSNSNNYKRHTDFTCKKLTKRKYATFTEAKTYCDRAHSCVGFTDTMCTKPGASIKKQYRICSQFGPLRTRQGYCTYENSQRRRMGAEDKTSVRNSYFTAKSFLSAFSADWPKYIVSYTVKFMKMMRSPYELMKKDVRCKDEPIELGNTLGVSACYQACTETSGCNLFLVGNTNPWKVRSINCWGYTTCSEFIEGEGGVELYYMRQFDDTDWQYIQADFATLGNKWYYGYKLVNSAHRYQLDTNAKVLKFHSDTPGRINSPEHCISLARASKYWKNACALTWFDENADFSFAKKCFINTRCVKFKMMDNVWSYNVDDTSRNNQISPISYKLESEEGIQIDGNCYMCWPSCNLAEIANNGVEMVETRDELANVQVKPTADLFIGVHFYSFPDTCATMRNVLQIKEVITSEEDCARLCIANDGCIGFESLDDKMEEQALLDPHPTEFNNWYNVKITCPVAGCGGIDRDAEDEDKCRETCLSPAKKCAAYQFYYSKDEVTCTTYSTRYFEKIIIAKIADGDIGFKKQPYSVFAERHAGNPKASPYYDASTNSKFKGCTFFQNYRPAQKIMYRYSPTSVSAKEFLKPTLEGPEEYAICGRTY